MISYDEIAKACSENDRLADGGKRLPAIVEGLGIDPEALQRAAFQRALRVLAHRHGLDATKMTMRDVHAHAEEFALYEGIWIDGYATASRVRLP